MKIVIGSHKNYIEEEQLDEHHSHPLFVNLDNGRKIIWNKEKQSWDAYVWDGIQKKFLLDKSPLDFSLRGDCPYCKSKLFINDNLSPAFETRILKDFQEKHSSCGDIKSKTVSTNLSFNFHGE